MNEFKRTPIQKRVSPESLLHPLTPSTKPSRFRAASADASEKSGLTTRVMSLLSVEYGKSRRWLQSARGYTLLMISSANYKIGTLGFLPLY